MYKEFYVSIEGVLIVIRETIDNIRFFDEVINKEVYDNSLTEGICKTILSQNISKRINAYITMLLMEKQDV